jgi:hypothetical protein
MFYYEVIGYNSGRKMTEEVKAYSQTEARQKFNRLNPDYKAGAANRKGRV